MKIPKVLYYVIAVPVALVHGAVLGVVLLGASMGDSFMAYLLNDKRPRNKTYCYRACRFFFF